MLSRIYPILLLIVLSGLCILLCPASGSALVAYWGSHPNKERLVLQFSDSIPQYTLARTDKENLTLTFSGWETSEDAPLDSLDFSDAVLFSSVRKGVKNLQIQTRTDAFGYLHFVLADQQKIVVDLFPDRMGEKWRKPRPELPEGARNSPGKQKSHESGDQPPKGQAELEKADSEPGLSKIQESDPGTPESDAEGVPEDFIEGIIKEQSPPSEEERKTSAVPASPKNQLRAPALKVGPDRAPILRASNRGSVKIKPKPPADPEIHEQEAKSGKGASEDKSPILDSPPSEPSPEIKKLLSAAKNAEAMGHLNEASILLRRVLEKDDLDEKVREFCLFELAEVTFREHHREMKPFFKEVVTALEHALNSFPESHRVPHALLLLGQTHLLAGNEPEAEAYFNILRNRYPEHPDIPQTFLFWGDHLLQTGRFTKAADAYQHVLDEYPESDTAKEAAVGLSKALWKSGFYDQAFDVIEFIKKRWSGYYLENPDILQVEGIVAIHLDEFDRALTSLWAKYNLTPEAADSDLVLARLGDAYLLDGKRETAREIYERTIL
ncbi:MAG: tetratricopeptide repeat protein, partial [Desulfovibrionales bacterium]